MRALGPATITDRQQRLLEMGAAEIFIARNQVFLDAAERARSDDLWWVKESYTEFKPGPECPAYTAAIVPGSPMGRSLPDFLKPWSAKCRQRPSRPATGLRRDESRFTLRIIEVRPAGFLCIVIAKNVDEFSRKVA